MERFPVNGNEWDPLPGYNGTIWECVKAVRAEAGDGVGASRAVIWAWVAACSAPSPIAPRAVLVKLGDSTATAQSGLDPGRCSRRCAVELPFIMWLKTMLLSTVLGDVPPPALGC